MFSSLRPQGLIAKKTSNYVPESQGCASGWPHAVRTQSELRPSSRSRSKVSGFPSALKEALATERAKALDIAAELAVARAKASEDSALIAQQKLRIAKLERQIYGHRSERSSRLIDQLALTFEELESDATEDELAAERAIAQTTSVCGFTRTRPERKAGLVQACWP